MHALVATWHVFLFLVVAPTLAAFLLWCTEQLANGLGRLLHRSHH